MKHKDEILRLRAEGKTYDEIKEITGASKGTISFHCGEGQKEKNRKRHIKNKKNQHPFQEKYNSFTYATVRNSKNDEKNKTSSELKLYNKILQYHRNRSTGGSEKMSFNLQDIINKFGTNTTCYLTGDTIDIYQPQTYQFDHIVPSSKGGKNTLDNLGICTKEANMSKTDHTLDDFLLLCEKILKNNGYNVEKL